jgi:murein DD-endopeptidase MepM/ murein hydrolase activator NlpD
MKMVRTWLVVLLAACQAATSPSYAPRATAGASDPQPSGPPHETGTLDDRRVDFQFEGGQLEFELYRTGARIEQVVRNRYAVPVMIRWALGALDNIEPMSPVEGTALLPAAKAPLGTGEVVVLAELQQIDPELPYRRELYFHARFGDPEARPAQYVYALPYPSGLTFSVLQGFHGAFSHRGSNEFAVDFNCPVATPVVAARPGRVVAVNASAQGSGTTPEYLDDKRANFVLVLHDDGTLGEYMHLAPSGVRVKPGQHVERRQPLGLSGNTGFSSTPHLHFQVMTAADDGIAKQSFPFELAIKPHRSSQPVLGQRYAAWE